MNRIGPTVLAFLELVLTIYLASLAWMLSGWFLDDHEAFTLAPWEWWAIALERVAIWWVVAAIFSLVVHRMNRHVLRVCGEDTSLAVWAAALLGSSIALAAAIGATTFAMTKPFM